MHRFAVLHRRRSEDHAKQHRFSFPIVGAMLFALLITAVQFFPSNAFAATVSKPALKRATFTLDGVTVTIDTPFLPGKFTTSKPGDDTQTATANTPGVNVHPYGAIYITAVPFGTKPTTEGVPVAQSGGAQAYRNSLYQYRVKEEDTPQSGPTALLFGQKIAGIASLMHGDAKVAYSSTVVIEWVVEAGKRLWIVRITDEEPMGTVNLTSAASFLASLSYFKLTSSTLSHATTVKTSGVKSYATPAVLSNYPLATWWNGPCSNNPSYTGGIGTPSQTSSQAKWNGIDACYDPTWVADANITINVNGQNMGGVSEWECVELSMRYMLVAGLINTTYSASGAQVVANYPDSKMDKISNGTVGKAPQAGDVLSYYNPNNVNGHTALVTGSNVNGSGTGTITILQQNSYVNGNPFPTDTLRVSNWNVVNDWNATITGWLDPVNGGSSGGGTTQSSHPVTTAQNKDGRQEVFARNADGNIWHNYQTAVNSGWSGWSPLLQNKGGFQGDPVVGHTADGRLEVFVRGNNGNIWYAWQTAASNDSSWTSNWVELQTGNTFQGDPAIGYSPDGRISVYARGSDGNIWQDWETAADTSTSGGGSWSGWGSLLQNHGGFQGDPIAAHTADGRQEVFVQGNNGNIWYAWQTAVNSGWISNWVELQTGYTFQGTPAVGYSPDGRISVYARGSDGNVWQDWETAADTSTSGGGSWSGWGSLLQNHGGFQGDPIAAINADGEQEVFVQGNNGNIWYAWQTAANSGWISNWVELQTGYTFQGTPAIGYSPDTAPRISVFALGSDNNIWQDWETSADTTTSPSGGSWSGWGPLQSGVSFLP